MADTSQMMLDADTGEMVPLEQNARNTARANAHAKAGTVMISMRVPVEFKERLVEMSKEQGCSQSALVISSVDDSASLSKAMAAVREYLVDNPPPFAPGGWEPSSGECMSFILRAVQEAIEQ